MDKKSIPRLLARAGLEVAWCQCRLWNYPVSSHQRSLFMDVFTSVSPQNFRDMGVGELHYWCSISHCIHQLLVKITDCSLALYFAVFEFLK